MNRTFVDVNVQIAPSYTGLLYVHLHHETGSLTERPIKRMNLFTNSPAQSAPAPASDQGQVPTLLITGATGTIGSELINQLNERQVNYRALVRPGKPIESTALAGANAIAGDFDDPASLARALRGIERAFLLTPSSEQAEAQQLRFVAAAKQAGVRHIVKLSQLAANVNSPVRFLRYHAVVERAIRESGLGFTFLRPNLFMQGLLGFRNSIAKQGQFFAAIGDAPVSAIDVRDIAAVAAAALTEPGHESAVYTLTGPQALTHAQMADELTTALNRPVTFVNVPPDAMRDALRQFGFPDWQADGLIEDYAHYARNEAAEISPDVEQVTGQSPRPFATFARDYAPAFS